MGQNLVKCDEEEEEKVQRRLNKKKGEWADLLGL
jgi:hypothetical protein